MRKILIFVALFSLLGISNAYAIDIIDAQPDTVCKLNHCRTTVDLSKYLTKNTIDTLKVTNLETFKPKIDGIEKFDYEFKDNTLIISGYVTKDVYWEFNLANQLIIDPTWYSDYDYRLNFTIPNAIVGYQGYPIVVNVSDIPQYECIISGGDDYGTENWANSEGYEMSFYRSHCNLTTTDTIIWYLTLNDTGNVNISLYVGNDTAVTDRSSCGSDTFTFCENEDYVTNWGVRQGGIYQQASNIYDKVYGYDIFNAGSWSQVYKTSNLSTAGNVNFSITYTFYGYNSVSTSNYFGLVDSAYAGMLTFKVLTTGVLQYTDSGWVSTDLVFNQTAWNILRVDVQPFADKMNLTLFNDTGSYSALNLGLVSQDATKQQYVLVGSDSANRNTTGDFIGIGNWSDFVGTSIQGTIETEPPSVVITNLSLFMNGNESNISGVESFEVNATAVINVTGLNVSLERNGTYLGDGLTSYENVSSLSAGLYNYTAYYLGNATHTSDNVTFWVEVTELYIPSSYTICANNHTLFVNQTYVNNSETLNRQEYIHCSNGCDNVTGSCNLPVYQQGLIALVVFGVMIFLLAKIYNWARR